MPGIYRHADAALFGGYLPYTEYKDVVSAKVQGFESIAISGHKFFGIDEPCGLFLTTKDILQKQNLFKISYLETAMPMIHCSRSTLTPLKFYWLIHRVGVTGFELQAKKMLERARYLKKRLDELNWPSWLGEYSNTVFFKRPSEKIMNHYYLAPETDERFGGELAQIVVMWHIGHEMIDRFIEDLKK